MNTKTWEFRSGPYVLCGNSHKVGKVDPKTLVVGQDVYMISGVYIRKGKVVKVSRWSGVVVKTVSWKGLPGGQIQHFDPRSGIGSQSTFECGPWRLDGIPFAERTDLLERTWADLQRKLDEAEKKRS